MDTFDGGGAGDEDAEFLSAIAEAEADGLRGLSHEGGGFSSKQHRHSIEPSESISSSLPHSSRRGHGHDYGNGDYGPQESTSKRSKLEPEGEYLAALRGTHSETWQAMTRADAKPHHTPSSFSTSANLGFDGGGALGGSGACFHCGKVGHWARDCPSRSATTSTWGGDGANLHSQAQAPNKSCPCGAGTCIVLTANTEKNAGRQFYRCPLRKAEGQCGFFEWCDASPALSQGLSKEQGSSYMPSDLPCPCGAGPCVTLTAKTEQNMGRQFYRCPLKQGEGACGFFKWCDENSSSAPAFGNSCNASLGLSQGLPKGGGTSHMPPDFPCPCGVGMCITLTAKTEKNMGRQFYRCPLNQGEGACGFFKWCDENTPASAPAYGSPFGETARSASNVSTGQCYKCGMDGHWAKDCSGTTPKGFTSTMRTGQAGGGALGPCYKCDQVGHWAKDCPNQQFTPGSKGGPRGGNKYEDEFSFSKGFANVPGPGSGRDVASGLCYICGGKGHWSSNCPNSGNKALGTMSSAGSGGCFKCGSQGHWSNDCPNASNIRPSSYGGQSYGSHGKASLPGKLGSIGSCFKCGGQGHYANECRG